jgi:hypothetical protein
MKQKYLAGGVVFFGILMLAVVWWLISSAWQALPSKQEVVNFASDAIAETPTLGEAISGSMVPKDDVRTTDSETLVPTTLPNTNESGQAPAWLTPGQQKILATLGVDVASLPTEMTPGLESCLVDAIGQERFEAVMAGDNPTIKEGLLAMKCL